MQRHCSGMVLGNKSLMHSGGRFAHYITLNVFKGGLSKNFKDPEHNKPNKPQYKIAEKIAKTHASSVFVETPVETAQM